MQLIVYVHCHSVNCTHRMLTKSCIQQHGFIYKRNFCLRVLIGRDVIIAHKHCYN